MHRVERPALHPALHRLWRDTHTLQIGLDPNHSLVLTNLPAGAGRLLAHLDGTLDRTAIRLTARDLGMASEVADDLVGALEGGAVLQEEFPGGAAAVRARRAAAEVLVVGDGAVATGIADLLAAAAVGAVQRPRGSRDVPPVPGAAPDLVVLAPVTGPALELRDDLMREGTPHLSASVRELTGVVGPLVIPGRTSCLRCHDLHRTDRDSAWPLLAAQLATPTRQCRETGDGVLAALVASCAALQALAFIDGCGPIPATVDGTLEVALPDWRIRRRSWAAHPGCGCTWRQVATGPMAGTGADGA